MIADNSEYVYSFNGYLYNGDVYELRLEVPTKLSVTNSAGRKGKRIGENFGDLRRIIIAGELTEDDEEAPNAVPLRVLRQRFLYAHRPEIGKARLVLNSAADGRPAEFVVAVVESVSGLKEESPINLTPFEVSFQAEPEVWFDALQTFDLLQGRVASGPTVSYSRSIQYVGPHPDFPADEDALPLFAFTVSGINAAQIGTADPPFVEIRNAERDQRFLLFPDANGAFLVDSYEEGIRKGAEWATGTIFEFADYDDFIRLVGAPSSAGVANALILNCRHCDLSAATCAFFPRHV